MSLNPPIITDVFFQADTVKGYRFWDETGVLANEFSDRFHVVNFASPQGLTCSLPKSTTDHLLALRVNTANIWLSHRPDAGWTTIRQETPRLIEKIARAIYVTRFSRLGLRVTLLFGGKSLDDVHDIQRTRILKVHDGGWNALGTVSSGEIVINVDSHHLGARIAVDTVQIQTTEYMTRAAGSEPATRPDRPDYPDFALRLDVDLVDKSPWESLDVKPHINHSVDYLNEQIIPFISNMAMEGS